jgi:hypothetical protein
MCEQVRADRDRQRHPVEPWWNDSEHGPPGGGCGALAVVSVVVIGAGVAAYFACGYFIGLLL